MAAGAGLPSKEVVAQEARCRRVPEPRSAAAEEVEEELPLARSVPSARAAQEEQRHLRPVSHDGHH